MVVECPKECLPAMAILVGELGNPKLTQIFAYGKWLYPYIILLHGVSDLDQRCLKTRKSEDECTFPPNVFAPTPNITPKPHFGDLLMQNRLSYVNGATMLKLYGYIGIGKYLGVCQNFSARGRPGSAGPLNVNLVPPPYYLGNYWN